MKKYFAKKKTLWILVPSIVIVLGGVFYLALYRGVHLADIGKAIASFGVKPIMTAALCVSGQVFLQATLLWALMPRRLRIDWWIPASTAFARGQLVNSLVPARAGEAVKAFSLSKSIGPELPLTTSAGMMVAEKAVLGLSLILLILIGGSQWVSELDVPFVKLALLFVGFHLVLVAAAFVLYKARPSAYKRFAALGKSLFLGLKILKNPRRMAFVLLIGLASWAMEILALHILCAAQGSPLNLSEALWVIIVLNLGIAIPISVANVGAFEAALAFGLSRFGIPQVAGLAIATVHHCLQLLCVILLFLLMSALTWATGQRPPSPRQS